jgi:hypothetical protein
MAALERRGAKARGREAPARGLWRSREPALPEPWYAQRRGDSAAFAFPWRILTGYSDFGVEVPSGDLAQRSFQRQQRLTEGGQCHHLNVIP